MVQGLGLCAFTAPASAQSLVREIRSQKLGGVAKKKKKIIIVINMQNLEIEIILHNCPLGFCVNRLSTEAHLQNGLN